MEIAAIAYVVAHLGITLYLLAIKCRWLHAKLKSYRQSRRG